MAYVPTKHCDRLDKHEQHEWKEGAFRRACPGRTTTKLPSRNVRRRNGERHGRAT